VLLNGAWPITDNNVTVITRWMRQENYIDTWWNRNNPLNNGWGSGRRWRAGQLPEPAVVAAENAAEALHTHPGYASIVAGVRGFGADRGHGERHLGVTVGERPLRERLALALHAGAGREGAARRLVTLCGLSSSRSERIETYGSRRVGPRNR
jgi:hypothetical protein